MDSISVFCRNPLNIRYSSQNNWRGSNGSYKGFVRFNVAEYGYRAALMLIRNYVRKGYNTPAMIITRWAPTFENPTFAYIEFVCKKLGWRDDYVITNMSDICRLCAAMARFESNSSPKVSYLEDICKSYNIHL